MRISDVKASYHLIEKIKQDLSNHGLDTPEQKAFFYYRVAMKETFGLMSLISDKTVLKPYILQVIFQKYFDVGYCIAFIKKELRAFSFNDWVTTQGDLPDEWYLLGIRCNSDSMLRALHDLIQGAYQIISRFVGGLDKNLSLGPKPDTAIIDAVGEMIDGLAIGWDRVNFDDLCNKVDSKLHRELDLYNRKTIRWETGAGKNLVCDHIKTILKTKKHNKASAIRDAIKTYGLDGELERTIRTEYDRRESKRESERKMNKSEHKKRKI